jgi:hypothetical protein
VQKLALALYTACALGAWVLPAATFGFFLWLAARFDHLYFTTPILTVGLLCAACAGKAMVFLAEKIESTFKF